MAIYACYELGCVGVDLVLKRGAEYAVMWKGGHSPPRIERQIQELELSVLSSLIFS